MPDSETTTYRRVNITLPEATLRLLERANTRNRSRLVDEAVRHYLVRRGRKELRRQLKAGALAQAERDRELAEVWFDLEEESWRVAQK